MAAEQLLRSLHLWEKTKPKLVFGENIRQTLQLAESGNADIAIVAWSLVLSKGGLLLPDTGHQPIRQAGGIVTGSKRQNEARKLLDLLASAPGRDLLRRFGFGPPQP